ncbi:hypothetical protein OAG35_00130 [bacterium]|nr:hypothetical protein [bacterium]
MIRFLTAVSALLIGVLGADWQSASNGSGKLLLKSAKAASSAVGFYGGGSPDPQAAQDEPVVIGVGSADYETLVLIDGAHASYPSLRGASLYAPQRSGCPPLSV